MRDCATVSDDARKVLVATFPGHHVAEKEGNELRVYAILDEYGNAVKSDLTTDHRSLPAPARLREMNRRAAEYWKGRVFAE
jgi:hypothetical protein